jgi:hypothetical protein
MALSFQQRVAILPDVMVRTVGDESVFLNLKTELYLGLDPVGTRMWALLTESDSIQSAYDALLAEYEVAGPQLRADLEALLAKLLEQQLIELKPLYGKQPPGKS